MNSCISHALCSIVHWYQHFCIQMLLLCLLYPLNVQGGASTIRVGVMLPFQSQNGVTAPRAIDFYRGLLMAMDSLRKDGYSFRVYTYNTAVTPMSGILRDTIIRHLDIVFGPDNNQYLQELSDYTAPQGTKVIDVFSPSCKTLYSNPHFCLAYAPSEMQSVFAANLFVLHFGQGKTDIIVVDTKKETHPFVIAMKKTARKVRFLAHDFTDAQLESRLTKSRPQFILISSEDAESAIPVLKRIASFRLAHPEYELHVLGYPEWIFRGSIDSSLFHKADTYIYTSFYNNVQSQRNQKFATRFSLQFGRPMESSRPVMAMMGFDCGYYLLKALCRYGRSWSGQEVYAAPLQNGYRFRYQGNSAGLANEYTQFVHYKTDNHIDLISPHLP